MKALQRTLRPALDLWRKLELQQQQQPTPQSQGARRPPLWGGLGLGWALLTWDAAVPGMALPPEPWAGLLDLAVRVVGEWDQQPEGGDEAWACLRAALGTVAIAAVAKREQQQQQPQGQGAASKPRRWDEALGRAAGAVGGLLRPQQQRSPQDDAAVRLAALPALVALTAAAGGGGAGDRGGGGAHMQDTLAQCWVGYREWQQQEQQRGWKEVDSTTAPPFLCIAALAAPAAAAALLQQQQQQGQGFAGTRLGQALQALAAELQQQLQQLHHQQQGVGVGGGARAVAASLPLLRGHDVLALPRMEVHYQQAPQQPMDVDVDLTMDDDEQPEPQGAGGAMTMVALDGRRAVLLPTTNQQGPGAGAAPPALLLLPAGVGLERPVHEWVGEVISAAWQQQDAWRIGAVDGWESKGEGLLNVRVGGVGGAGAGGGGAPE